MARVRQTITKTRRLKVGGNSGYHTCPNCKGSGHVRDVGRPRKKK